MITTVDVENVIDALIDAVLSPEFLTVLQAQWNDRRAAVPFRMPEYAYEAEVETPDGYPCVEFIAITESKERGESNVVTEISAQWSVNGDNPRLMSRELRRFMQASRKFFEGLHLVPYAGVVIRTGEIDYGPAVLRRNASPEKIDRIQTAAIALFFESFV